MRVVLDTNVVVSGLLFGGGPGRLVTYWRQGRITPLLSRPILDEYLRVLAYPRFSLVEEEIRYLLEEEILPWFEVVTVPGEAVRYVADDPADDKFVCCAVAGKAEVIVSGDRHLLALAAPPVPVITVQALLARLTK